MTQIFFIISVLLLVFTSAFLKQDIQSDQINFITISQQNQNSYTYQYNIPFRNTPTVIFGISDFSMTPNYNYLYFYISTNNGNLSSQTFYFSNYQITELSVYFLAMDLNYVNFISYQNSWYWWSIPPIDYRVPDTNINQVLSTTNTNQVYYSFNYNNTINQVSSKDNFIAFAYIYYADIKSQSNIGFGINCSVIDNQTVQIYTTVDNINYFWGYSVGVIVIDLTIAKNRFLTVKYTYISSKTKQINFPLLKHTIVGLTGFNITSYMNTFAINLELETNNFIVSSNVNEAKMSLITFFDTIDSSQIQLAKRVQITAEAVALFVTVIGIYANRMIGLQLIAVLQTAFFMLSTMDYAPEILNTLNQYCIAINGYNRLYQNFPNVVPLQYKYSNIPQRLKNLGYQAEFVFNINYMLVLNSVLFVLGLLLKILRFPKKLSEFMFKDLFFGMTIFNTMNIGFSIGAYFTYFTFDSNITYGNNACILVAFALTIISGFIYALKQTDEFQGYTMHLKQERHLHPLFHFGHKFLMALIMGFFTFYPKLTYILVVVSGIYLLYIVIMKPYKNSLLQFRAFLNEAVICLIAVVALYYQNYANNDIIQSTQYLAWSQNAMVLIITIMSALIMLREVYNRCTGNRQYKIMEESKMNNLNDNKGKLEIVEAPGSSQHNIEVIRFNEAEESPKNNTKRKFIRKNVRQ